MTLSHHYSWACRCDEARAQGRRSVAPRPVPCGVKSHCRSRTPFPGLHGRISKPVTFGCQEGPFLTVSACGTAVANQHRLGASRQQGWTDSHCPGGWRSEFKVWAALWGRIPPASPSSWSRGCITAASASVFTDRGLPLGSGLPAESVFSSSASFKDTCHSQMAASALHPCLKAGPPAYPPRRPAGTSGGLSRVGVTAQPLQSTCPITPPPCCCPFPVPCLAGARPAP